MKLNPRIKVIALPHPGRSATVALLAFTGGRYETFSNKGISHFVEHMLFKGTKQRSKEDISGLIENCGGDLNGFTDEEITMYHATVPKDKLNLTTNILLDMVLNPVFETKEVNRERDVIIQELKRSNDSPQSQVWEDFHSTYFDSADPMHWPIIGTKNTLNSITTGKIKEYYNNKYQKLVLIIIGAERKQIDSWENTAYTAPLIRNKNQGDFYLTKREGIQQSNVLLGNFLEPLTRNTILTLNQLSLLSAVYNDMSGRLMGVIREKYGMVYGIGFKRTIYSDGTIFWGVQMGLDAKNIKKARELVVKELTRPLTKEEIKLAQQKMIGTICLQLDDPLENACAVAYGQQMGIDPEYLITENLFKLGFKKAAKNINDFQKELMFKQNLLVGVIPGGK